MIQPGNCNGSVIEVYDLVEVLFTHVKVPYSKRERLCFGGRFELALLATLATSSPPDQAREAIV